MFGSRVRRALAGALLVLTAALGAATPAPALVGGTGAGEALGQQVVMIVSTRGAACTGAVLAPDLLLTAAHCVAPRSDYAVALVGEGPPQLIPAARIAVHPRFDAHQFESRRPTPDLALVRLAEPLPARFRPASLTPADGLPSRGTLFTLAGFGVTADGAMASAGTLRALRLPVIGTTGGIMVRLSADSGAAGACTGDSGGPAFQDGAVAGVISWATAAGGRRGCGGVTGVTLVSLQRDWIVSTAAALGSPLGR